MESPIDTSHDITTNEVWIGKQIDRISGWEILKKNINRDYRIPNLCWGKTRH